MISSVKEKTAAKKVMLMIVLLILLLHVSAIPLTNLISTPQFTITPKADLSYYDNISTFVHATRTQGIDFDLSLVAGLLDERFKVQEVHIIRSSWTITELAEIQAQQSTKELVLHRTFDTLPIACVPADTEQSDTTCSSCDESLIVFVCITTQTMLFTGEREQPLTYRFAIDFSDKIGNVEHNLQTLKKNDSTIITFKKPAGRIKEYVVLHSPSSLTSRLVESVRSLDLASQNIQEIVIDAKDPLRLALDYDTIPEYACQGVFCTFIYKNTRGVPVEFSYNTLYYHPEFDEYFIIVQNTHSASSKHIGIYARNEETHSELFLAPKTAYSFVDDLEPQLIPLVKQSISVLGNPALQISFPQLRSIANTNEYIKEVELRCFPTANQAQGNTFTQGQQIENGRVTQSPFVIYLSDLTICPPAGVLAARAVDHENNVFEQPFALPTVSIS